MKVWTSINVNVHHIYLRLIHMTESHKKSPKVYFTNQPEV